MKVRLTPLNLISSVLLIAAIYALLFEGAYWSAGLLLLAVFAFTFVLDLLFRRVVGNLRRIWLYELVFVIFVGGLIFLFRV